MRRREGIKRSLRDITLVSHEEYDDSWDLEGQSKKCKSAANCLLASCEFRSESEPIREETGDLPVHLSTGTGAEMDRRARTRTAPERYRARVVIKPAGTATQLRCVTHLGPRKV